MKNILFLFLLIFISFFSKANDTLKKQNYEISPKEKISFSSGVLAHSKFGPLLQIGFSKEFEFEKLYIDSKVSMNFSNYSSHYFYIQNKLGYKINNSNIISIVPFWFEGPIPKRDYYTPVSLVYTFRYKDKLDLELWNDFLLDRYTFQVLISYELYNFLD